jgi:metal-responsive CopG/Arc/MetJ family transcriptional regulator
MRVKTSVTLPEDVLAAIDKVDENRSGFLEREARQYLARLDRAQREKSDAEIYEREMDYLNAEALDALEFQSIP